MNNDSVFAKLIPSFKHEAISIIFIALSLIGLQFKDSIPYNFLTSMFMHGSWGHLSGNMTFFLMLSPAVEKYYGKPGYLLAFLYTAIIDYLFQTYMVNCIAIGMSGFVFALFMLNAMIGSCKHISLCGIILLFMYGGEEIAGLFNKDGVCHSGHLLGLFTGLTFAWAYNSIKWRLENGHKENTNLG